MASSSHTQSPIDALSVKKVSFFNGMNFFYWKDKMTMYIQINDLRLWKLIRKGYEFPTKIVDGIHVLKEFKEYSEEEENAYVLNKKSLFLLVNAININEYNKVRHCKTAKDMWRMIEINYEGIKIVKQIKLGLFEQIKLGLFEQKYEMYKMLRNETISEMFVRFPTY